MSWTPKCDKGCQIKYILMDGYGFGGPLLEGVMFRVRLDGKRKLSVEVDPNHTEYFENLNKKKWLAEARKAAKELDAGSCPECKGEVEGPFQQTEKKPRLVIPLGNFKDLLGRQRP